MQTQQEQYSIRSKKELLNVMLQHPEEFNSGLCDWIHNLFMRDIIEIEEHTILLETIRNNRPILKRKYDYYWKSGDIKPRISWIKRQLFKIKIKEFFISIIKK